MAHEYMNTFFWEIDVEGYLLLRDGMQREFVCVRSMTIPHYHELATLEKQCSRLEPIDKSNYHPYFRDDGLDYYNLLPECSEEQKVIFQQAKALHALIKKEMRNR